MAPAGRRCSLLSLANRLANQTSPYLLQHALDPVDWRPWGEEPFFEARERDVPVLLSVGCSACHWCHDMARESFSDEATARLMNARFVNVKGEGDRSKATAHSKSVTPTSLVVSSALMTILRVAFFPSLVV
jgi:hypothetical protein